MRGTKTILAVAVLAAIVGLAPVANGAQSYTWNSWCWLFGHGSIHYQRQHSPTSVSSSIGQHLPALERQGTIPEMARTGPRRLIAAALRFQ